MAILVVMLGLALPLWGCGQAQEAAPAAQEAAPSESTNQAEATQTTEEATQESATQEEPASQESTTPEEPATQDFHNPGDGYKLQQVVVLSRHNIRAPLSTTGSALDLATPHSWINWTANASELTMRGGALETMAGEYVRKWLETEGLIPENYQPKEGEVRFYANSKQRTIATAQYFSSGMLPVANVDIETHVDYDTMDPVFNPVTTFITGSYVDAALKQMETMGGATGAQDVAAELADSYALIEDVVDYKESDAYKSGEIKDLDTSDIELTLEKDKEPAVSGSLKTACQLSDGLVLQYYETPDDAAAAFGHDLTAEQWTLISRAKDFYGDLLFTSPLVAYNVAHPLLEEIGKEMDTQGRVFTFLCGHDSNIGSVLAALGVEKYELPGAIETATPIGVKLVFERWADASGKEFGRVRLMYQSVEQLREGTMLAGTESPMSVDLSFDGLEKNADGLFSYDELRSHIADAAAEYDNIVQEYGEEELDQAA